MTELDSYIRLVENAISNLQLAYKLLPKECEKQEEVLQMLKVIYGNSCHISLDQE